MQYIQKCFVKQVLKFKVIAKVVQRKTFDQYNTYDIITYLKSE